MTHIIKSFQYGDQTVTLETGEIARQADGAVMVNMNDTVVLVTVVIDKRATVEKDFSAADRRLSGKNLCRRAHPRRLFSS